MLYAWDFYMSKQLPGDATLWPIFSNKDLNDYIRNAMNESCLPQVSILSERDLIVNKWNI